MTSDALNRAARQIALPQVGLRGQEQLAAATIVVVGDDLTCEIIARALAAGGVGKLRLVRRTGALPLDVAAALGGSNPDIGVETWPWPSSHGDRRDRGRFDGDGDRNTRGVGRGDSNVDHDPGDGGTAGADWLDVLAGAAVVVRSGFDDDPMLRAAVRLGVPAVATRSRDDGVEMISFRRHGPCPHAPVNVPEQTAVPPRDGAAAVVAGHLAAAEVLLLLVDGTVGVARARQISLPMNGEAAGEPRTTEIPWAPECFACGGYASEMSFA